jgi:hypothetical protein
LVDAAKSLYRQRLNAQLVGNDWRTWREHWRSLWDWTDSRLPLLADGSPDTTQEQSDAVHDLLAFLAEQMIELNQRKQAGAATFTSWLEQETGSSIDAWNGKTMIQGFWETPWATIERTLQKNRGTFAQVQGLRGKSGDAAMVPLLRSVQARWQQATNLLAPTLAAIAATDRLIDLLVYRLYGLTDEEIDLVERA